jgi:uncharacterized protein (TIGR02246 family)
MKRSLFALCAALVLSNNFSQQVAAAESNSAEDAIRRTAQQFVEAYDQGKAQDVAALWTPDGEYAMGRETLKGRKAIANLYETFFKAHPGSKMKVNIESVRMVAPTVAIEQGTASTTDRPSKVRSESAYTAVHVKQDGKWLMASVRESEIASKGSIADLGEIGWLIGLWEGEGAAKSRVNYAWMLNKHFIKGEFTSTAKDAKVPGGTQIIGRDPLSGRIISWFFNADGGQAFGEWRQQGSSWLIKAKGVAPEGARTAAVNVLYRADDNVISWKSVNRSIDQNRLPDTKEVVMERSSKK